MKSKEEKLVALKSMELRREVVSQNLITLYELEKYSECEERQTLILSLEDEMRQLDSSINSLKATL